MSPSLDPNVAPLRVGQACPDFTIDAYDPAAGDFAEFSLAANRAAGKWTILFFYPADFTFV
jgi:peroxiredoxin (alkyl hydroperoxide reductase subunit C)